ncbi:hypothetical protein Tco_1001770 [Tanacetum coccineum]
MTTLQFADTHNLVEFLSKPAKSEGFEQIVDFLNANLIRYELTINPTIYTSCIKQFWATVKVKTVNGEVQLQALVDVRKIIITKASVRRDLHLNDEECTDCFPNATIFEELTRMGYEKLSQKLTLYKAFFSPQWKFLIHTILQCLSAKTTAWNKFSSIMASTIICLATNQKFNFSKYIFESMVKNLENVSGKFLMYPRFVQVFLEKQLKRMSNHKRIYVTPSHTKKIFRNMRRVGKSFSGRETPLFPTMMIQAQEEIDEVIYEEMGDSLERATATATSLDADSGDGPRRQETMRDTIAHTSLKRRVKRLDKKGGSITHRLKRLYKVGLSRRVESSDEEGLGNKDASKQGRIADIDADAGINLVSTHFDVDTDMFGVHDLVGDEVVVEREVVIKAASTIPVSAATTTTAVITNDEITLAKVLDEQKSAKLLTTTTATTIIAVSIRPKAKGLVIHEQEQAPTPLVSSQQPSQLNVQDKGKGKMVESEPVKKLSKKDQLMIDEELAFKLQAKEEEEDRPVRQREEEANIVSWDNVQAMIDVDYQMA